MFFGWPREIGKLFWAEDAGRVLLDGDHPRFMSHCLSLSSSPGLTIVASKLFSLAHGSQSQSGVISLFGIP
jgi:hypothetical protein